MRFSQSDQMRSALRESMLDALAVLFPIDCAGCGAPDRALCAACRSAINPRVQRRVLSDGTSVIFALQYDGVVRANILAFKRRGRTDAVRSLAGALRIAVDAALESCPSHQVELTAVPSSRAAFRRRGYDPVRLLLARARLPSARTLVSVRDHAQQKTLDRQGRQANLAGTLRSRRTLNGRSFIIVDDVVTTGATLVEAARALRAAGARVLCAVALANTERHFENFE